MAAGPALMPSHEKSTRFTDAVGLIEQFCSAVTPSGIVLVGAARSRIFAADIVAPVAVPPHDNSAGDEDHVKSAVETLGSLDFWNVAIRPGRPIAVGRIGAIPFFGLPGNPAAMVVTFS